MKALRINCAFDVSELESLVLQEYLVAYLMKTLKKHYWTSQLMS